ncbi:MAG: hypothetical protein AB8G11_18045 [Saprospiraceae bacterium]
MQNNKKNNILQILKEYTPPMALGLKLLAGAILSAIIGNKWFTYIIHYRLYYYCSNEGIRVPAEGLDILNPTINIVSFGIIFLSGVLIVLFSIVLILLSKSFLAHFDVAESFSKQIPFINRIFFNVIFFIFFSLAGFFLISVMTQSILDGRVSWNEDKIILIPIGLTALFYILVLIPYISKNKSTLGTLNLIFFVVIIMNCFSFFGSSENIKSYLFKTKYGGDYPVMIVKNCQENEDCKLHINGSLFLRTKEYIYLKIDNNKMIEIPNDEILSITYSIKNKVKNNNKSKK